MTFDTASFITGILAGIWGIIVIQILLKIYKHMVIEEYQNILLLKKRSKK